MKVKIIERNLHKLIKNYETTGERLPETVGAVYLDFPANIMDSENKFTVSQLLNFIKDHPDVLFIIDQANLYFQRNEQKDFS